MNGKKIAGVGLSLLGAGSFVMDTRAIFAHRVDDAIGELLLYFAAGAFGIGMLLIDTDWVINTAKQCASFLPWGNKPQPPAGP